uniref:Adhesion G protein-coupled receptor E1 n=2 Tax=Castor canadensis TaxID=51338 RepID=A0A8B7UHS3_CASCN|nr:adhesion G protein-coupled receptor E1 [Castor canadensis]
MWHLDVRDVVHGPAASASIRDVNECADTTACPAYAICTNVVGSYFCTCKQGFMSSNGEKSFSGPGVVCEDVNECIQNSTRCGPNSACDNLLGRYKCSCLTGFSSPTGNDWIWRKQGHFACTDIDECLTIGICPEHSHCTNSMGSYSCSCKVGFISSNSTCEDVDECEHLKACPEHATCYNTLGSYYCTCNPGFESSSRSLSFQGLGESCDDVDECSQNSTLCGLNSICVNIPGEYSCSCLPGFFLASFQTPGISMSLECIDIDECVDRCPLNSTCTNTPGSYFCNCHPGFASSDGQLNFTDLEVECGDINECLQDPSPCGPNSVCTNVPGSYSCRCIVGFRPNPDGSQTHGNFSCKRVPFKCKEDIIPHNKQVQQCQAGASTELEYVSFCKLVNATFSILGDACENKTITVSLKSKVETFASVLKQTPTWTNFTKEETSTLATVLLESVESAILDSFLKPSVNVSQTIHTEYLDIESKVINEECNETNVSFHLKAKGDEIKIGCSIIEESESAGITGVAFVSFANMESILDERFFQDPQTSWANSKRKLKMNSRIVGGIMTGEKKDGFSNPIIYTLENIKPKQELERPICVSWSTDVEDGRWMTSGCEILEASETHTVCSCHRMANLAIIMASGELTMEFSLYVISHVGMVTSLVCLSLAIATFLFCRAIRNHNTYLHLHLCVSLFLAKLLFLIAIEKTDNQMGCALIAGFLHYLFLACFFWMLVEAVMLFLMVRNLKAVNYLSSRNIKIWHLCAFGYGLPGLVVTVSASVQPQGYGMHNRCWLNTETGFIWSFLGPVCMIITINTILLTWTLWVLRQKLSSINAEVSILKDTRLLTFKAFAQIFILGSSWVLGIFQIGPTASIMAYLFTIINSLQGTFIFLIHCVLNRQVREEYKSWMTRKRKSSSQSQTSQILLSSMPFTSKTG